MTRPRRVYQLDITYPDREHAAEHPDQTEWRYDAAAGGHVPDEPSPTPWPVERLFLSRSGAQHRARKLREWGCTVTVHPSDPIIWPEPKETP
jgi:hypothetical protein